MITVTGTGFGTETEGINLRHAASGSDICTEVTVTAYGSFTCMTSAMDISSLDQIDLVTATGTYSCANTINSADCGFEQLAASSPTVSSATLTDSSTIDFAGSGFLTADHTAVAVFQGVESSSAVINSSGSVTATFSKGVPLAQSGASPILRFDHVSLNEKLVSVDSGVTITNTLTLADSTSGLSCSFSGGCTYAITATGLASSLLSEGTSNQIDVCGNHCIVDADLSDAS